MITLETLKKLNIQDFNELHSLIYNLYKSELTTDLAQGIYLYNQLTSEQKLDLWGYVKEKDSEGFSAFIHTVANYTVKTKS